MKNIEMTFKRTLIILIGYSLLSCNSNSPNVNDNIRTNPIPNIDFTYIKSYPHDTNSFTEGLLIDNGKLYESTGATKELPQTRSLFGVVNLKNGKIDPKAEIDKTVYFGEGIAFLKGKVYQLTYKNKIGFVYDAITFKKIKEFTFPSKEGWGLTTDGTNLIMSDGTYELTYLDPIAFQVVKKIPVTENGYVKEYLNELEYISGFIFANIWSTNTIVKIDPTNGKVVGKLDLNSLYDESIKAYPGSLEMNGIAYDSIANRVFVTGKMWPKIYELKIEE